MKRGKFKYVTKTGREISIKYSFENVKPESVPADKDKFSEACKIGCKNYNKKWSCPPCSPSFANMKHKKHFLVIMLRIDGKYFSDCTEWMKLKAINSILKPKIENIVKGLANKHNGYEYISGACRKCKNCAKKINEPCKYPDKLRYSLESVGIDCNKLVEKTLNEKLCWYNKGGKYEYGSVVGAVELNDKINSDEINDVIIGSLKG